MMAMAKAKQSSKLNKVSLKQVLVLILKGKDNDEVQIVVLGK